MFDLLCVVMIMSSELYLYTVHLHVSRFTCGSSAGCHWMSWVGAVGRGFLFSQGSTIVCYAKV